MSEKPKQTSERTVTTENVGWDGGMENDATLDEPYDVTRRQQRIAKQLRLLDELKKDCNMITADLNWYQINMEKMHANIYKTVDLDFFEEMQRDMSLRTLIMRTSELSKPPLAQQTEWRNNYRDRRATQMFAERDKLDLADARERIRICRIDRTRRQGQASTNEATIGPE